MAKREAPVETAASSDRTPSPPGFREASSFDPSFRSQIVQDDPVALALLGAWRNRQQYGREAYDQMMRHGAASIPFRNLISIISSVRVSFQATQREPTKTQRDMADFLNAQLKALPWTKIVEGFFGQGYQYGFSLAELSTSVRPWRGRPFVQVDEIAPLPQKSLDNGMTIQEFSVMPDLHAFPLNYTCFDFDTKGRPIGFHQYRRMVGDPNAISWTGGKANRILYFKRGGGDGNPFGESVFYSAFDHWADCYLLEKQEQVSIENAMPYITASYEGDEPKPALHEELKVLIAENDPNLRILVGNNLTFSKISASDPDYVNHLKLKKRELRDYITLSLLMPNSLYRETDEKDLDTRNLVQMFLKFTLPAYLDEIAEVMTEQFGKRLVDANYSNVEREDYPRFRWRFVTPNDVRLVQSFLQMILPHLDSTKLGEVFAEYMPSFDSEYVAQDPKDSVGIVRQAAIAAAGAAIQDGGLPSGTSTPPPKKEGETRERLDGQTENSGQVVGTDA